MIEDFVVEGLVDRDEVFFLDFQLRVAELLGEFAIVGEDDESFGIAVESADVVQVAKVRGEEGVDRLTAEFVVLGADVSFWFIKKDGGGFVWQDAFAVDFNEIVFRDLA